LSRIVPNNGDSHKSSMYQNVQTCILEVNSTRIGIEVPALVVLPYNTMIYYPYLKSTYFHHWETWHLSTNSQLPSGLSAGSRFKWCEYRQ